MVETMGRVQKKLCEIKTKTLVVFDYYQTESHPFHQACVVNWCPANNCLTSKKCILWKV